MKSVFPVIVRRLTSAFVATTAFVSHSICCAQSMHVTTLDATSRPFIRVVRADDKPVALQTSIEQFSGSDGSDSGVVVDLVGVVHVGDQSYYEDLNRRLQQYDVVLYELVAPEDRRTPQPHSNESGFRWLHRLAQSSLGLSSQLDFIDYTAKNFAHADLSPAEMSAAMEARGDNALTVAMSAFADVLRQANRQARESGESGSPSADSSRDLVAHLADDSQGQGLKTQLALQFDRMSRSETSLGPTLHQLLVSDRNEAAMKVFQRELAKGKRRIAIFYGAAHLPDFANRLEQEFGLTHQETTWLDAWDLSKESQTAMSPLNAMFRFIQSTNEG